MPYRGHVKNGVVVFDEGEKSRLPEGSEVIVDLVDGREHRALHAEIEMFSGILPPDIDVKTSYVENRMDKHR